LGQYGLRFNTASFDIEFLRDVMTTGQTITTTVNATFQPAGSPLPTAVQVKFLFTCVNANATYTSLLGSTFSNVYEVDATVEVSSGPLTFPLPDLSVTSFYARGVGLVGVEDATGFNVQDIRYWRVN
jgi:hypothetical protein